MRLAVISDTHLGSHECALVGPGGKPYPPGGECAGESRTTPHGRGTDAGEPLKTTRWYEALKETLQSGSPAPDGFHNDYLILLGDILDFSIGGYTGAFKAGRVFFEAVHRDRLAREIIYVPGNHDFDIWTMVEFDANIRNRLQMPGRREVQEFRHAVAGLIDDRRTRPAASPHLTLLGVTRDPAKPGSGYGGLFLDAIFGHADGSDAPEGPPPTFLFAYPNVYVATDDETILLTHGQYFERYWSFGSRLATRMPTVKSRLAERNRLLAELVALDHPAGQLACSGIGQAGILTELAREVVRDLRCEDPRTALSLLDELVPPLKKLLTEHTGLFKKVGIRGLLTAGRLCIRHDLKKFRFGRGRTTYWTESHGARAQRFERYLEAIESEVRRLGIEFPATMVHGHTHVPKPWADRYAEPVPIRTASGDGFPVGNTGSWLFHDPEGNPSARHLQAEVFLYSSGTGFSSAGIR